MKITQKALGGAGLGLLLMASCASVVAWQEKAAPPGVIFFTDITKAAGVNFHQSYGDFHMDNIVKGTGTGVCVFDYNNDGLLDIYFPNGKWTRGVNNNEGRELRGKLSNHLFRNNGNGTFTEVTTEAGVGGQRYSIGCSAADYDNDGFVDLLVLNYGQNELFHNNGNGTFTEVATKAGLTDSRFSLSAVWYDYNNDGYLDVYVSNYLYYDDGKFRDFYPAAGYPGPLSYNGLPNALYRNNGDGTFTDVTKDMGMWKPDGRSMSVTAADFNNDGKLEILSTNDAMENYYFEMNSKGVYEEKAIELNVAYSENGQGVAHMGPVVGDINRDGLLDIFIPDLSYCSLLIQRPDGKGFDYRTNKSGLAVTMGQYAGWASMMFDYDHDGWLDIFTTHGNAHHEYKQENTIVRNKGDGTFEDVSVTAGAHFKEKHVGRGGTGVDLNNDGRMDLVIVNVNDDAIVLRNDTNAPGHWLTVTPRLKFSTGTRDAYGARIIVEAGGMRMIEDMIPTRGYLSAQDSRINFGLGKAEKANIEIRWPDGKVEKFKDVKADQFVTYVHPATATKFADSRVQK
jgi:hypothetical protein